MYALVFAVALLVMPAAIVGSWAWLMDARAYRAGWTWTDRGYAWCFVALVVVLAGWVVLMIALPKPWPSV